MDSVHNQPVELTDAELATIQGGFLGKVFRAVMAFFRGNKPPPPVSYDPQQPFSTFPRNPGSPAQH